MWTFTPTSRREGRKCRGLQSLYANLWFRSWFRRTMSESVVVFFILFMHLILSATAEQTAQCPKYTYYDHGTNHCEKCNEICDKALHLRTEDQCRELCPAYAKIIWPEKPETPQPSMVTVKPDKPSPNQPPQPGNAGDNSLVLAVGIPLAALLTVMVSIGIVIHVKKRRRASRRPRDVESVVQRPPESARMLPLTAAGTAGAVAGVQEEGELLATSRGGGLFGDPRRSLESSLGNGCSPVPSPPVSPPGAQGGDSPLKKPVQVLDQSGATEMVLNSNRPSPPRYMSQCGLDWDQQNLGALGWDRNLTEEEEYHSTEVKTSDYSTSPLLASGAGDLGLSALYP